MKKSALLLMFCVVLVVYSPILSGSFPLSPNYPTHDDFEDGVIDPELWITGGEKRAWHETQPPGLGNWSYTVQEISASDGYLQMRVWGPTSANTYGAEAWVQTAYNFNDGYDHLINFTWEADVVILTHYDHYYIQVTDGWIPYYGSVHWPRNQPHPGTVDFLWQEHNGEFRAGAELISGLPKTTWSLMVSADGVGRLFDGPNATGTLLHEGVLNTSYEWYLRLMVIDATSSGFPAGDDRLNLYDFSATVIPAEVAFDIKPGSCPNPLNTKSRGQLPVAILGTENFDVMTVDPEMVALEGVSPLRWSYEDVASPVEPGGDVCECSTGGPDGYMDMTLKFETQSIVAALGSVIDGETRVLTLTGMTYEGAAIEGQDCVVIRHKQKPDKPRPHPPLYPRAIPDSFGSYPNPFNATTTISFTLKERSEGSLVIYNILGEKVRTLISGNIGSGIHRIHWDGKNETGSLAASGIYFCCLKTQSFSKTMKLILLR